MVTISWCKKEEYPNKDKWKSSIIKVSLEGSNKIHFVDFHNFEEELVRQGFPLTKEIEEKINDFLWDSLIDDYDYWPVFD